MFQLRDMSCCCNTWYLIHCQARKERYASHALESHLGLSIFLPEYRTCYRGKIHRKPFFPGYIFIQADLKQVALSQINAIPGVIRLVAFGNDPVPVPFSVIDAISERLANFELMNLQPFHAGDVVRVKQEGPLQDLEMIFVGPSTSSRRVMVLLNLLGRLKKVHLDIDILEKVSSSHSYVMIGSKDKEP